MKSLRESLLLIDRYPGIVSTEGARMDSESVKAMRYIALDDKPGDTFRDAIHLSIQVRHIASNTPADSDTYLQVEQRMQDSSQWLALNLIQLPAHFVVAASL